MSTKCKFHVAEKVDFPDETINKRNGNVNTQSVSDTRINEEMPRFAATGLPAGPRPPGWCWFASRTHGGMLAAPLQVSSR